MTAKEMLEIIEAVAEEMEKVETEVASKEARATIAAIVAIVAVNAVNGANAANAAKDIRGVIKDMVNIAIMVAKNIDLDTDLSIGTEAGMQQAIKTIETKLMHKGEERDINMLASNCVVLIYMYKRLKIM